jgi:hypothetical protein
MSQKSQTKFLCEKCDYTTSRKNDYDKHILTPKHKNVDLCLPVNNTKSRLCDCGKTFSCKQSLYVHRKVCKDKDDNIGQNLIVELIKQNQDFKDLLIEQNTKMFDTFSEAIKNNNITNNNNSITQVNSNNKTFNLQVFLNEDCKDAMNVSDFMNSLNLQVSDLECVGQLGFVEGISNIIIKRLNAMDITKRPVHCTDSKRETIYIKEDGVWTKDDDDNMKIRKLVRGVSFRNCRNAGAYKAMYPECRDPESKHSYIYDKIVLEAFGGTNNGKDEENENKIIRKILKHLTIDKSLF